MEWNLLYVTVLVPRVLRQILDFWKIYTPCTKERFWCL